MIGAILVVVLALGAGFGIAYRDLIFRYATHWKGAPSHTEAWTPFPAYDLPLLHFVVVGDVGDSGRRLDATATAVANLGEILPFDALLVLGDNAYPHGDPALLPGTIFEPFAPTVDAGAELLAVLGNHDVKRGHATAQVDALGMPGRWWARTLKDVLVIGLDSNAVEDPKQLAWLNHTLARATERWRIVMIHHPPYSAGYQGSDERVRSVFSPVFERYDVQLVLSGHDHDYQRSKLINGVTYVVTGAASGTRRTGEDDFTAVSFSWHHFVELAVYESRIVIRAVNQVMRVGDDATIRSDPRTP